MTGLRFVAVDEADALAQPLLAELAVEYASRYEAPEAAVARWLRDHPAEQFAPPDGGMYIGVLDSHPVTGGAFCRFDDDTAELKRIWTDSRHRRAASGHPGIRDRPARLPARLPDHRQPAARG